LDKIAYDVFGQAKLPFDPQLAAWVGMAPWDAALKGPDAGRMIAYFRPFWDKTRNNGWHKIISAFTK